MPASLGVGEKDAFTPEPALWVDLAQKEEVVNAGLDHKQHTVQQFLSSAPTELPLLGTNNNILLWQLVRQHARLLSFLLLEGFGRGLHQLLIHARRYLSRKLYCTATRDTAAQTRSFSCFKGRC